MLEFCTLGTGGTLPIPDRALSSLYVRVNGRALLIDCGEGTQVGIRRLGWGFRCLDGLLMTHYHGDHCTGLAFDITDEMLYAANYEENFDPTVADTEVCKWMEEHCAEYGFIVRYPEGKEQYYTLACHPGHFRYVGEEAAQYIMENDLTLEEFIDLYKENTNYPKGDYPKAN